MHPINQGPTRIVDGTPDASSHTTLEKPAIQAPRLRTIADEASSGMEHTTGTRCLLPDIPKAAMELEVSLSQDTHGACEERRGSRGRRDHLVSCWQGTDSC